MARRYVQCVSRKNLLFYAADVRDHFARIAEHLIFGDVVAVVVMLRFSATTVIMT